MAALPKAATELASTQRALVTRSQLLDAGLDARSIDRLSARGELQALHPGVYRIAGAPSDWHQAELGACLAAGPGAVASHRAAGRLWRLTDATTALEVTVPRHRAPQLHGVTVHRSTDLVPGHVTVHQGIPVTTPLRLMVDLGAVAPPWQVEDALDRGLVSDLLTVPDVEWMVTQVGRRGRRGVGSIRRVLDERALGAAKPDGLLEPRMARLLRDADLPIAAFQHVISDARGRFVARVDFAYTEERIAIEVDGFAAHGTRRALQMDLARQNALVSLGWTVLRFTWHDVVRCPGDVARTIRNVLGNFDDR